MEDLQTSLNQYNDQLNLVSEALETAQGDERDSLMKLKADLHELILLTQESLNAQNSKEPSIECSTQLPKDDDHEVNQNQSKIDDEYALFMQEMAESGAYEAEKSTEQHSNTSNLEDDNSDIEDELTSLLGMKCGVYHTHKWGGQPTLYNAMVSAIEPHETGDQFKDLQVRVLFTHPTHADMLPCPFFLDGECRFSDDQCRFSHGALVNLSSLTEAIKPNFESIKVGSRILLKLKPPDDQDVSLTKKNSEIYHLWHRAVVKSVDFYKKVCVAKLENGVKSGGKRKSEPDEYHVKFEEIFPLNAENNEDRDSEDSSISDTEYPEIKTSRPDMNSDKQALLVEQSLKNNAPAMGEWERHTRGIGSKLMIAMGYVPGTGLGSAASGRLQPVEARVLPVGKSLDHCMAISEKHSGQDPLKVEQRLKRLQKKEEERNRRAYEREKERERRNVFNFINQTLGKRQDDSNPATVGTSVNVKESTSKNLNIERFKITEDVKKIEREIVKLKGSLSKYPNGSPGNRNINLQIEAKNNELTKLKTKEQIISKEQQHRKDKQKMSVF